MPPLASDSYSAVLFDLDGTLVDTAPDMVAVLQALQTERGVVPVGYELGRSYVSNGAVGLLRLGFPGADDDTIEQLRLAYLALYAQQICERSAIFPGLKLLLDHLQEAGRPWGVVTNKPQNLSLIHI